jgi:hypothetical protein
LSAKYDWFCLRALQDAPRMGGVLVGLAVQSAHRSLFPAVQLQRALIAHAAASFNVLYGFPIHRVAPVFARVGYRRIGELTRHATVIRSAYYLGRRLPQPLARLAGTCIDQSVAAALLLRAPVLVPLQLEQRSL